MKYIIDVDKDRIDCSGQLFIAVDIPNSQSAYEIPTGMWVKEYTEPDRKAIEDEVWELADYMCRMGVQERDLCFGFQLTTEVTANLSYQEAKSKFEAWLKQKDEIRAGDEVFFCGDPRKEKAIVLRLYQPKMYKPITDVLWGDGSIETKVLAEKLMRTGRHFNEVEELLKKMRDRE